MRGFRPGGCGHDCCFRTFDIVGRSEEGLTTEDMNAEVIARARAQNEQYLELMTRVGPAEAYGLFNDPPPVDDPAKALEQLRPKLDQFIALCRSYLDKQDVEMARRQGVPSPL